MATTRVKMVVTQIKDLEYDQETKEVHFGCMYDPTIPEDQSFNKFTPWGNIVMGVNNPFVLSQLRVGDAYYIDFTKAS